MEHLKFHLGKNSFQLASQFQHYLVRKGPLHY